MLKATKQSDVGALQVAAGRDWLAQKFSSFFITNSQTFFWQVTDSESAFWIFLSRSKTQTVTKNSFLALLDLQIS